MNICLIMDGKAVVKAGTFEWLRECEAFFREEGIDFWKASVIEPLPDVYVFYKESSTFLPNSGRKRVPATNQTTSK